MADDVDSKQSTALKNTSERAKDLANSPTPPQNPQGDLSTLGAWREEKRLDANARVRASYNRLLDRAQDTNIGIANLARSEIYKEEALDEMRDIDYYLAKKQRARDRKFDLEEAQDETELLRLKREQAELQREINQLSESIVPNTNNGQVIDEGDYDQHKKIADEAEAEIALAEQHAEAVRQMAKEANQLSEEFERQLNADTQIKIDAIRDRAFKRSQNV